MPTGPIQLIALGFEDFQPTGKMLPALLEAMNSGIIRLIDLQFVRRDLDGNVTTLEMSGLNMDERLEFGAAINRLISVGSNDEAGAIPGSLEWAVATAGRSYGMSAADVQDVAGQLPRGGAAAFLMIEHTWATEFRQAVQEANGFMMAQGFLTAETLVMIGAELQAQVNAMQAIQLADAAKLQAAREAARAVALADTIRAEAARQAIDALVAARLIEETAMEEAIQVVATAMTVSDDYPTG